LIGTNQLRLAVEKIQQNEMANLMMAPKVTTFNGRTATIETGVQRPFVVGGDPDGTAEIRTEHEGIMLSVEPLHQGGHTRMDIGFSLSTIKDVNAFTFGASGNRTMTVEVPRVEEQSVRVQMSIPKNQSMVVGMPSTENPEQIVICFVTPNLIVEGELSRAQPSTSQDLHVMAAPVARAMYQAGAAVPHPLAQPVHALVPAQPRPEPIWLLKADGPPPSAEVVKQCEELFVAFDAYPRLQGDWSISVSSDATTLRGKNLSMLTLGDGFELRCGSGAVIAKPQDQSMAFQADAAEQWHLKLHDPGLRISAERIQLGDNGLQAQGNPIQFELNEDGSYPSMQGQADTLFTGNDGELLLTNSVRLSLGDNKIAAESAKLLFGDVNALELRGDVTIVRNTDENPNDGVEIRCQSLDINLSTGEFSVPD